MKKRGIGLIGLACLTAGIGLTGCAGSNSQPETTTTAETTTTVETTTVAETTPTTEETTTTTEGWRSKYENALIQPQKNPEEAWGDKYKVEFRLSNGVHLYLPSFFERFQDGQEGVVGGNVGYNMSIGNNRIDYSDYDDATNKIYKGKDYFESNYNEIKVGIQEGVINILCDSGSEMPKDDEKHKYIKIGEADDKVYYIDFTPPYWDEGIGWESYPETPDAAGPLDYYNKYADLIAETAWVEKIEKTETKVHPEDEQIMENLRAFYKSHEIVDGVPGDTSNSAVTLKYTKYAIADFDYDGINELILSHSYTGEYTGNGTSMYEADSLSQNAEVVDIPYKSLEEITFLDNGIAYTVDDIYHSHELLDNKCYYLLDLDWLGKLNYNMQNANYDTPDKILVYYMNNGKIMKYLASAQDSIFAPKEKTQSEYEQEKQMLNSGNVMNIEVKDFTAENIGL